MRDLDEATQAGARRWAQQALAKLHAEAAAEQPIPLRRHRLPDSWRISLFFRDESLRPTGSLKHRLVRRLIEEAIVRGDIRQGTTIVEATAGNTAIATAYFAQLIGVPFVAVVPGKTAPVKRQRIERYGGRCHTFDPPAAIYDEAARLSTWPRVLSVTLGEPGRGPWRCGGEVVFVGAVAEEGVACRIGRRWSPGRCWRCVV